MTGAVGLAMALGATMLIPALLGYERYVITGGSMTGTYDRGSILFAEKVPSSDLKVGDVITFTPPPDSGHRGLVTHRILSIHHDRRQGRFYRTKGDANRSPDPWKFSLPNRRQPRGVFAIPYLGFALGALGIREVRLALIGVPALAIAFSLLLGMWREAGLEARREPDAIAERDPPS
ncbi:MAG: signal peptidase [Solirubrobacteraceae bacterium]|jgi:signal peptidase|nr:signal peptidase [Solirubrobacteraceae bacterium]